MKLVHLSVASIIGCLLGLLILVGIILNSVHEVGVRQEQVADLLALQARINDFSVASDSLLLFGADADLLAAYRREGQDLQQRLRQLDAESPDVRRAAHRIETLLDAVSGELERRIDPDATTLALRHGALELPARSRIVMNHVAGLGGALDSAVNAVLRERQRIIAREAWWIGGTLAGAALLFGALAVIAFLLIHRRVAAPARSLARTLEAIRAGDPDARAPVHGDDELADLAATLNRMLDERQQLDARLRQRNERLQQFHELLEGSDDLCAIADADYRYLWVNQAYRGRYRLEQPEIEGLTVPEVLGEDHFEQTVKPRMDRCLAGEVQRYETERDYAGLGRRNLRIRYYPIDVPGRSERLVAAVITDVTDIRAAAAELERQAALLEMAGQAARFGGWFVDLENNRVEWSEVVAEIHGMPQGYSASVDEGIAFYAPEYRARIRELFDACVEQGEPYDEELQILDANGQRKWVRALGEPGRDEHGRIVAVQGAFQDVTSRREGEQRLRKLAHIVDQSPAAIAVTDLNGHIEYVNPAFEAVSAYPREELLGDTPARIKSGNTPDTVYRELWETITAGQVWTGKLQNRRKDGSLYWESEVISPLKDEHGETINYVAIKQDITELKETEQALLASRDELSSLLESRQTLINSLPAHIALLDAEGTVIDVNDQWRHFGEENASRDSSFGVGQNYIRLCETASGDCADEAMDVAAGLRAVLAGERETFALEYPCHSPDQYRWFRVMANRLVPHEDDGADHGAVVMHIDITERKQHEVQLRAARDQAEDRERRYRVLAEYSPNWDYWLGVDGTFRYVSPACEAICGYPPEAFLADPELMERLLHPDDRPLWRDHLDEINTPQTRQPHEALEMRIIRPDGTTRWIGHECAPTFDKQGQYLGQRGVNRDVTDRKRAEQQLDRLAFEDPQTGLYSRNGFSRELQRWTDRNGWQAPGTVVMVDIIGLRDVNDAYGYEGGDRILVEFSQRLLDQTGEHALTGRIGGDEFTLFLLPDPGEALEADLNQLVDRLSAPFDLDGVAIEITFRLGYTRLGEHRRPTEDLLREAERALFRHRWEPSAPWVAYSNRLQEETQQRIELTQELRQALHEDQFELHFQPKVDLASGTLVSCEALLRWNHPERGLIPPGVFIPIAEQSQLIAPIGDWALRHACQHLRDWRDAGLEPVRVAVNVSLIQFQTGDFPARVRAVLDQSGVASEELALEITESVFERESETLLNQMRELRDMGVRLSLDDFGTGYSSLLYLQRYPFHEIKIDQGFVFHLLDDPFSRHIVETVMMLARALDAEVMAEGIESVAVTHELLSMGCRYGQGYYYSMPLEAEDFRWLLERRGPLPLTPDEAR